MGKVFKNWIGMNGFKMKTKNVKFTVVGSRCRQNLKVGRRRQRNVLKTCHKSCNSVISGVDVAVIVPRDLKISDGDVNENVILKYNFALS